MDETFSTIRPRAGDLEPISFEFSSPFLYVTLVFLITLVVFYYSSISSKRLDAPLIGSHLSLEERKKRYIHDCISLLRDGWQLLKRGTPMYRLTTSSGTEIVILHPRYIPELRTIPDATLDIHHAVASFLAGKWASIADRLIPLAITCIKADLTPALSRLTPIMAEEVDLAFARLVPDCTTPTSIPIYRLTQDLVTQISARLFVGHPTCHDPTYLDLARDFSELAFVVAQDMLLYRPWQQIFMAPFIPSVRRLVLLRFRAISYLRDFARQRRQTYLSDPSNDPDDFTKWLLARAPEEWKEDYSLQAEIMLRLAGAATHTTSSTVAQQLLDLVVHPEYITILRDEIISALATNNNQWDANVIRKLRKMDSFMKESFRFSPTGPTIFKRYVAKDTVLSDGTLLPKGTFVEVDIYSRDFDTEIVEDANEFDGLRWFRLRERGDKGDEYTHKFETADQRYLQWGSGKHACPGRFLASMESKRILAKILLEYDIAPGANWDRLKRDENGRPRSKMFGRLVFANSEAKITFTRRSQ
ncbi:Cytochrome P450-like protein 32 [Elsinoe fawcettii]|nr:Cytochrome P450-like protein 32 [Elsinoe fawcettii]